MTSAAPLLALVSLLSLRHALGQLSLLARNGDPGAPSRFLPDRSLRCRALRTFLPDEWALPRPANRSRYFLRPAICAFPHFPVVGLQSGTPPVPLGPDFASRPVRKLRNIRDVKSLPACKIPGKLEPGYVDQDMIREGD